MWTEVFEFWKYVQLLSLDVNIKVTCGEIHTLSVTFILSDQDNPACLCSTWFIPLTRINDSRPLCAGPYKDSRRPYLCPLGLRWRPALIRIDHVTSILGFLILGMLLFGINEVSSNGLQFHHSVFTILSCDAHIWCEAQSLLSPLFSSPSAVVLWRAAR